MISTSQWLHNNKRLQNFCKLSIVTACIIILSAVNELCAAAPGPATLIRTLKDDDTAKKNIALEYIKKNHPPELLPHLASAALKSWKEKDREMAVAVIKLYPPDLSVAALVEILKKTRSPEMKIQVIEYLSGFNDRRVSLPVAAELKNPKIEVREAAAKALTHADDRIYPVVLEMAESDNPALKLYALQAFNHIYDRRFYQIVLDFLADRNKSVRIYALICIRTNGLNQAITKIRSAALNDDNDEVRIEAIKTIGAFTDKNSLYVLYETLNDKNRDIRLESVIAIESIKEKRSSYPLSDRLLKENDDEIKKQIIGTLVVFNKAGNIRGLKKVLLEDGSAQLRIEAAYAIGSIRDNNGIPVLVDALKDGDYRVRAEASASLGNFKNKRTASDLLDVVVNDKDRYVRSAALYALKKINDRKTVLPLYDLYALEQDPVFKEQLRGVIRFFIERFI